MTATTAPLPPTAAARPVAGRQQQAAVPGRPDPALR